MKTVRESRLIITNLSEEEAIGLLRAIREEDNFPSGIKPKFELDHPDPPYLLEEEYVAVDSAISDVAEFLENAYDGWESATKKSEVLRDLKVMKKMVARTDVLVAKMKQKVTAFEVAAASLK